MAEQWRTYQQIDGSIEILDRDGRLIADMCDSLLDAALIVRAVNAHDDLVKALRAAKGHLLNAVIDLKTSTKRETTLRTLEGGLRVVDEALAKVEGA